MRAPDPSFPAVFSRAEAAVAGLSEDQMDRRLVLGRWERLRRGQYTQQRDMGEDVRWRAEVLAVVRAHRRPLVLSHEHAARAWGLPGPLSGWGPLSFISDRPPGRRRTRTRVTVADLSADDVVSKGAVLVTSPARTVVDCARILPGHDALAIADAALRRGLVTGLGLQQVAERLKGWPGLNQVRRVLSLADPRRETPLESWSAWAFAAWDLPTPRWQAVLCDPDGTFLGRADAWWRIGVLGEADGRVKYRLAALERGGIDAEGLARVLDDERRREADLRRAGALIVRWSARDVLEPAADASLARHIREQLELAGRLGQFSGRVLDV